MIRVTTLYASTAASTAKYYTRYLTDAPGELPGQWAGQQAVLLGLNGTVTTGALERLLSGRDPVSGVELGFALKDRTLANGKVIRAVAGFDATVSAPKSLSVLWALTGDPGFAEAHDVAVQAVLSHLERFGSTTRIRSNGGRLHPDSQGLIVAGFRQTTSRADDPQLHTHLVISSKVQTGDGRWLALDARMLKRYQRTLGGLYQSVLRAELTDRYGVGFGEIVKGQAEIAGVPAELLALFSKRTVQVDDALAMKMAEFYQREGRDPTGCEKAALTREAAADTRVHKTSRSVDELRPGWLEDAADIGVTPESLLLAVHEAGLGPGRSDPHLGVRRAQQRAGPVDQRSGSRVGCVATRRRGCSRRSRSSRPRDRPGRHGEENDAVRRSHRSRCAGPRRVRGVTNREGSPNVGTRDRDAL